MINFVMGVTLIAMLAVAILMLLFAIVGLAWSFIDSTRFPRFGRRKPNPPDADLKL